VVFTNGVRLTDNIFFGVSDLDNPTNALHDLEIEATKSLHYVVQGTGTSRLLRAALRNDEMPVVLALADARGNPVPRTLMGQTNALAPPKEATIVFGLVVGAPSLPPGREPEYVRGEAIRSRCYIARTVGPLRDFFEVKEPGIYTLEARLRYWCPTNKTWMWFLSEPVRLPVIVRDPKLQAHPEINHVPLETGPAIPLSSLVFSNGIRAVDDIYFAITTGDGPSSFSPNRPIDGDTFLSWSIHNRGSGRRPISHPPGEVPVVLTLRDSTGIPVPRTPKGISNALAPPSDAGSATNRFERISGLTGSHMDYLSNFFVIKAPGTYVLEARFRYWYPTNEIFTWALSEPVRIPVIVRDPLKQARSETNAAMAFQWAPLQTASASGQPPYWDEMMNQYSNKPFGSILRQMTNRQRDVMIDIRYHTPTNRLVVRLVPTNPPPIAMAVTVDQSRPPESAWVPFQTNYVVTLPPIDGRYKVGFSFRFADRPMYPMSTDIRPVTLDTTPPVMIFTNPPALAIAQCRVRLQGYFTEPVRNVRRTLRSGFRQSELVACGNPVSQFDPVLNAVPSRFDCDLQLSPGPNDILVTCEDDAGNLLATNITLIVNRDNKPPRLALTHPMPNAAVKGEHISVSGQTDDAETAVRARVLTGPVQITFTKRNSTLTVSSWFPTFP